MDKLRFMNRRGEVILHSVVSAIVLFLLVHVTLALLVRKPGRNGDGFRPKRGNGPLGPARALLGVMIWLALR